MSERWYVGIDIGGTNLVVGWFPRMAENPSGSGCAPPIPHAVEGNLEINRLDFDLAFQVAASSEAVAAVGRMSDVLREAVAPAGGSF